MLLVEVISYRWRSHHLLVNLDKLFRLGLNHSCFLICLTYYGLRSSGLNLWLVMNCVNNLSSCFDILHFFMNIMSNWNMLLIEKINMFFMDNWFVTFMHMLFDSNWLDNFMNNISVVLMDYIDVMFNDNVLMMLMNNVLNNFFNSYLGCLLSTVNSLSNINYFFSFNNLGCLWISSYKLLLLLYHRAMIMLVLLMLYVSTVLYLFIMLVDNNWTLLLVLLLVISDTLQWLSLVLAEVLRYYSRRIWGYLVVHHHRRALIVRVRRLWASMDVSLNNLDFFFYNLSSLILRINISLVLVDNWFVRSNHVDVLLLVLLTIISHFLEHCFGCR